MYPGFQQSDKQCVGGIFEMLLGFTSTLEDENFRHFFV